MSLPRQYRRTATARASVAGDEARDRVLEVAAELFAISGYRGTSIAQVAERAGLSQSGLLHHFPSKVALLTAALERHDELDARLLEIDEKAPVGWAAFDALTGLVRRNSAQPQVVRLFVTLTAEALDESHPAHAWAREHYDGIRRWLHDAIVAGRESGEMRPDTPVESLVALTVAVLDGLQSQWLLGQPEDAGSLDMVLHFTWFVATLRAQWGSG